MPEVNDLIENVEAIAKRLYEANESITQIEALTLAVQIQRNDIFRAHLPGITAPQNFTQTRTTPEGHH